jgi:hypothetical protein
MYFSIDSFDFVISKTFYYYYVIHCDMFEDMRLTMVSSVGPTVRTDHA